ncbi:hypothetical protein IC221_21535 [Flammeovirga sp. EKP202]|nr:hypothetical protein [Flammeovirga sp. EKP202]
MDLSQLMQGYSMYYRLGLNKRLFGTLQGWTLSRLRMIIMKPWKRLNEQLWYMNHKGTFGLLVV